MAEKFVIPIHGGDHCPGGPDPIPCLSSTSSLELSAIASTATGGLDIPADTWEDAVAVAQNRKFTYAFDSDGEWSFSNTTGIIERNEEAAYVAYARCDFQSVANDDLIGVGFRFNSNANFFGSVIPVKNGKASVAVSGGLVTVLMGGANEGARAYVYCNPAATITRLEFIVRRFERVSAGTEYSF